MPPSTQYVQKMNEPNVPKITSEKKQPSTYLSATKSNSVTFDTSKTRIFPRLSPQTLSILSMTFAMALHFFGYEFTRSASLSLFTSSAAGFTSPSAIPLAMAAVSPLSILLLLSYGRSLDHAGPRRTLTLSTLFCSLSLIVAGVVLRIRDSGGSHVLLLLPPLLVKALVGLVFVFQNCYATLLYNQHFSFMGSIMSEGQGKRWFACIAGVSSISSTVAGSILPWLIHAVGVTGLLCCAGLSLILSAGAGDMAYGIAENYGFDPAEELRLKKKQAKEERASLSSSDEGEKNVFKKASALFARVPRLAALFAEVLSFYGVATILNVCFVTALKNSIPNDDSRAIFMGKFFAGINGTCGLLQFVVLPFVFKRLDTRWMWRIMPLILIALTSIQLTTPSLFWVSASFFAVKVMDYSSRAALSEMVYVPLDFESRYIGKEVIGMFGNGFGKSGTSLVLAGLTTAFGFGVSNLCLLSSAASAVWLTCSFRLSRLLPKNDKSD